MKTAKHVLVSTVIMAMMGTSPLLAQSQAGDTSQLPGENFSLEGALEMFKKAGNPEEFEKLINAEDNKVNNLDLNGDGTIDYIKVINRKDNDVQIFVLQAIISATENQDVAVIELEKTGNESAVLQIVGDEDLYGEETVVEPAGEEGTAFNTEVRETPSNIHGPSVSFDDASFNTTIIVNVWAWPSVRYVYAPGYNPWFSSWSWTNRPIWWRPWRPMSVVVYRPFRYQYRRHYVIAPARRVARARVIYRPARVSSVTVRTRNQVAVNHYRATRVTKTTTVNRGNRQYKATKKTTTVRGRNGGQASRSRTTVRRTRH